MTTADERRRAILSQPAAMKEVYAQDTVNPHTIVRGPDGWHLFYGPGPGSSNFEKRHATSDDLVVWSRRRRCCCRAGRAIATTPKSARPASSGTRAAGT